jgi:iron(III) transport system substrate-binding protein
LRALWGEEATEQWLETMIQNQPTAYPRNAVQVSAAGTGEIAIGWVNHYYLHRLKQQQPDLPVKNYSFPEQGDAGNILMIVGAGITNTTSKQEQAEALLNYLISEPVQLRFTNEVFEYPAQKTVATHPDVPSLESLRLIEIDQGALADVGPTLELLKKHGLL